MPSRPVHWYEGMFLRPQHFQVADRNARDALTDSEDWYHAFNWGFRSIELSADAVANSSFELLSCEARLKDGTKLRVPADAAPDPIELKSALSGPAGAATIYLGVPALQAGRANVEEKASEQGPRYSIETITIEDENTGGQEQLIEVRRTRCRLLVSGQDHTGYVVLPIARVERTEQAEAAPRIDPWFVPPILALDAWTPLWRQVKALHHQIASRVEQLADQMLDRGISFDSQVPGDAERMLKLGVLNGAFSYLEATAYLRGLHPLGCYAELARLVGQLALFTEARRPPNLPLYDHEDLGPCFAEVIRQVQLGLATTTPQAFEKRYFERVGERLQVALEPDWTTNTRSLYLGVETSDLADDETIALLQSLDLKLGSGDQVEHYFKRKVQGMGIRPVSRAPRSLPAAPGLVYYEVQRDPVFWRAAVDTASMAVRVALTGARFLDDRTLEVQVPARSKLAQMRFALFVIEARSA